MSGTKELGSVTVEEIVAHGRANGSIDAAGFFTQSDHEFELDISAGSLAALQSHLASGGFQHDTIHELKGYVVGDRPYFTPLDS